MKIYTSPSKSQQAALIERPALNTLALSNLMSEIFSSIFKKGDRAVREYTKKFDRVDLENFQLSKHEIQLAIDRVSLELKEALQVAYENIHQFHSSQNHEMKIIETKPGVQCWQKSVAIEKVGIYIPGGTAPLCSTVLMLAIPAHIAGCKEVALCSPPGPDGHIAPEIIYAAKLCNVTQIFKVGGAQAIAAMSLGTESIPKVYKIFGPGNQYVTAAKQKAFELGTAIDLPAGPSELLVFADSSAKPEFIAADLLSQAEHGIDSQVVLVSNDIEIIHEVVNQLEQQMASLPRKKIAEQAILNSFAVLMDKIDQCFEFVNLYAPEHLILASEKAAEYIGLVRNAGSVFVGNYTPESAGDYASGTNHTLPTNGYARSFSGVNLDTYVKKITFQSISEQGLSNIGKAIITMAEAEKLEAHSRAIKIRLNN